MLRGEQCAQVDEFAGRFKDAVGAYKPDAKRPWEHVSAAVGYAIFDFGEDEDVNATLRRADKSMYANKVSMKAERT